MSLNGVEMQVYDDLIEEALQNGVSAGTIIGMINLSQTRNPELSSLPDSTVSQYVTQKETLYLVDIVTREKQIEDQLVINLAMKILDRNGTGIYLEDLSVYGDRPDNLGIDDGKDIVFYSTPEGVRVNNMTAEHMQLLESVLIDLERFAPSIVNLSRGQRIEFMSSIKTTSELHQKSWV